MTNDYSTEADMVGDALDAVYENKQVNKKDDISGDYSSDTASYPTVKAVKGALEGKLNVTHTGQGSKNVVTDSNGSITFEAKPDVSAKADKTGGVAQVTDPNANNYSNIGSLSSGATQQAINAALNTKIGAIEGFKVIEITTDKGTASADTLGKLYIVSENSKVNIYYTKQTGSGSGATYSWEKMDADILDELVVNWDDVQNKPTFIAQSDIDNSVADFASAIADRINPSSP